MAIRPVQAQTPGIKVSYGGFTRHWLKDAIGVTTGQYSEHSAHIVFTFPSGDKKSEWVGISYLDELKTYKFQEQIAVLEQQRDSYKKKIDETEKAIEALKGLGYND